VSAWWVGVIGLGGGCGEDAQVASDVAVLAPDLAAETADDVAMIVDVAIIADIAVVDDSLISDDVGGIEDTTEDTAATDIAEADSTAEPFARVVRFAVLGDTGTGSETQRKVAVALRDTCARRGCDFAILLGDNIYDVGVTSVHDAQWDAKFEIPYADVDIPFRPVLGNHDNGGFLTQWLGELFGGAGAEFERGDVQVAYSEVSTKWLMPARTYDFRVGPAHFFALDTNDMVWSVANDDAEARTWIQTDTIPGRIDGSSATWKIAMGHHPWISNGRHGDAGEYEGLEENITDLVAAIPFLGDLSDVVTGDGVRASLDTIACGRVDIYFAGHDHNLQWFEPTADCPGTHFVVSGAGAKTFQHDARAGFFWVQLRDTQIEVEAVDEDGAVLWSWQGFKSAR
jgi:hypothetical protein